MTTEFAATWIPFSQDFVLRLDTCQCLGVFDFSRKKMRRSLFSFSLFSTVLIPRFIGARITFASLYRHGWLEIEADSSPAKMYNAQICTESIGSFNSV